MIRPKGLGRGLDALLVGQPTRRRARNRCRRSPSTACGRASTSRARGWTRRRSTSSRRRSASRASCSRSSCGRSRAARFEIIAGERRWRAAQRAGLHEVPALVKAVPDQAALALALIENIQREDLNPLEEAQGLDAPDRRVRPHARGRGQGGRPLAQRGHQPAAPARARASRCRSTCSPAQLDMGHARALLGAAAGAADRRGGARRRAGAVGARDRAPRPPARSTRRAQAADARRARGRRRPRAPAGGARRDARRQGGDRARSAPAAGRVVIGYSSLEQLDGTRCSASAADRRHAVGAGNANGDGSPRRRRASRCCGQPSCFSIVSRVGDLVLARRLDVERLDDAVVDQHREALAAHAHAACAVRSNSRPSALV